MVCWPLLPTQTTHGRAGLGSKRKLCVNPSRSTPNNLKHHTSSVNMKTSIIIVRPTSNWRADFRHFGQPFLPMRQWRSCRYHQCQKGLPASTSRKRTFQGYYYETYKRSKQIVTGGRKAMLRMKDRTPVSFYFLRAATVVKGRE